MAETAQQVDFLISGCRDNTGAVNGSGKVYFFKAGDPNTNKAIYEDKAKTTAYDTKTDIGGPHPNKEYVTLDSNGFPNAEAGGLAEVYADGTYDVYVYNSADVLQYTLSSFTYVVPATTAVVASYHTSGPVTPDGTTQVYYFDTTAGNIAANISVDASALSAGTYITFIIVNGSNSVTITPNGSGTIAGESTWTITGANTVCRIESDGTNDDWGIANVATHDHSDIENGGSALAPVTMTASSWPSFSVHRNGTNSADIGNVGYTKIRWTTEEFDTNNNFEIDTDDSGGASESIFTPTVAGKYVLTVTVELTAFVDQQDAILALYKNGAEYKQVDRETGSGIGPVKMSGSVVVDANGTDTFEVYVWQSSGSTQTVNGGVINTFFTGCRIG